MANSGLGHVATAGTGDGCSKCQWNSKHDPDCNICECPCRNLYAVGTENLIARQKERDKEEKDKKYEKPKPFLGLLAGHIAPLLQGAGIDSVSQTLLSQELTSQQQLQGQKAFGPPSNKDQNGKRLDGRSGKQKSRNAQSTQQNQAIDLTRNEGETIFHCSICRQGFAAYEVEQHGQGVCGTAAGDASSSSSSASASASASASSASSIAVTPNPRRLSAGSALVDTMQTQLDNLSAKVKVAVKDKYPSEEVKQRMQSFRQEIKQPALDIMFAGSEVQKTQLKRGLDALEKESSSANTPAKKMKILYTAVKGSGEGKLREDTCKAILSEDEDDY